MRSVNHVLLDTSLLSLFDEEEDTDVRSISFDDATFLCFFFGVLNCFFFSLSSASSADTSAVFFGGFLHKLGGH